MSTISFVRLARPRRIAAVAVAAGVTLGALGSTTAAHAQAGASARAPAGNNHTSLVRRRHRPRPGGYIGGGAVDRAGQH